MLRSKTPIGVVLLLLAAPMVQAAPISFQIKPAQSTLTLSGVIRGPGGSFFPIGQPVSGSLATSYTGNLLIDPNAAQIVFMGGAIDASVNGQYMPGPSPADYGLTASLPAPVGNLVAAIRGLTFTLNGPTTPLVSGFDLTGVSAAATGGSFDSNAFAPVPLAGAAAVQVTGNGTVFPAGDLRTLSMPLTVSFSQSIPSTDYSLEFSLSGIIVATHTLPEPVSASLLAAGAVALAGRRSRQR